MGASDEMSDEGDSLTKGMLSSSGSSSSSSKLGSTHPSDSAAATGLFSRFTAGRNDEKQKPVGGKKPSPKKGAAAAPAPIEDVSGLSLATKPDNLEGE